MHAVTSNTVTVVDDKNAINYMVIVCAGMHEQSRIFIIEHDGIPIGIHPALTAYCMIKVICANSGYMKYEQVRFPVSLCKVFSSALLRTGKLAHIVCHPYINKCTYFNFK